MAHMQWSSTFHLQTRISVLRIACGETFPQGLRFAVRAGAAAPFLKPASCSPFFFFFRFWEKLLGKSHLEGMMHGKWKWFPHLRMQWTLVPDKWRISVNCREWVKWTTKVLAGSFSHTGVKTTMLLHKHRWPYLLILTNKKWVDWSWLMEM